MGTYFSAQTTESTFYTSEQSQVEVLSELEDKLDVWNGKIKALRLKIEHSECIRKFLPSEIRAASEYLRTKLIEVQGVGYHAPQAKSDHENNRPPSVSEPGQEKKNKYNPVQTNSYEELQTCLVNALEHNARLEESNKRLLAQLEDLSLRLSRLAGERLTDGNPNITDLSDRNRPTKLGEVYSELYDNEWTNAFDGLIRSGYDELEAIQTLKLTLLNIYDFCGKKAETMLTQTEEAVNCLFKEYKMLTGKKNARPHLTVTRNQSREIRRSLNKLMQEYLLQSKWKPKTPAAAADRKLEPTYDVSLKPESKSRDQITAYVL
ncbi:uncharacterized protein LOC128225944 [Mya arenaria]|nr:uncharacterized protein LOC128225944 [Mya arenaria]